MRVKIQMIISWFEFACKRNNDDDNDAEIGHETPGGFQADCQGETVGGWGGQTEEEAD